MPSRPGLGSYEADWRGVGAGQAIRDNGRPGDKTSRNWRSRHDGLHLLAQGAFAGIRNVATHTDNEWSEQIAVEHLAALSVVARWAGHTTVVRNP